MDELQLLFNEFDFEENKYFYHITNVSFSESIIDSGLGLYENDLKSTTIEITKEDVFSLDEFLENEYVPGSLMQRNAMVILQIPVADLEFCINESEGKYPYFIDNRFIIGYIDLREKRFFINPNQYCIDIKHI